MMHQAKIVHSWKQPQFIWTTDRGGSSLPLKYALQWQKQTFNIYYVCCYVESKRRDKIASEKQPCCICWKRFHRHRLFLCFYSMFWYGAIFDHACCVWLSCVARPSTISVTLVPFVLAGHCCTCVAVLFEAVKTSPIHLHVVCTCLTLFVEWFSFVCHLWVILWTC